jgi:Big-like domain-containing protein
MKVLLLTLVLSLFSQLPLFGQSPVPTPWTSQDIGSPTTPGSSSILAGTFTVTGAGTDIWDTSDQFHFVSQLLTGDGEIVARVMSLGNTDPSARAGVMMRETLTADAPNVMVHWVAGGLLRSTSRALRAGPTVGITNPVTAAAPYWVRLVRTGNVFTAFTSATGTNWVLLNTVTVPMASNIVVGLAVNSLVPATATTGVFSNVTVTSTVPPPPPPSTLITSTSQMFWDQAATDLATAQGYIYASYVDGVKGPAMNAVCQVGAPFTCSALVPVAALVMGTHTIEVTSAFGGLESTSRSNSISVTFAAPIPIVTVTTVVMTGTPTTATFTATVVGAPGIPFGSLVFKDGGVVKRTTTLNAAGVAVWNVSNLVLGSHVITAEYAGNATYAGSVSAPFTAVVTIAAPTGLRVIP